MKLNRPKFNGLLIQFCRINVRPSNILCLLLLDHDHEPKGLKTSASSGFVALRAAGCQHPDLAIFLRNQKIKLFCRGQTVPVRMLKLPFA